MTITAWLYVGPFNNGFSNEFFGIGSGDAKQTNSNEGLIRDNSGQHLQVVRGVAQPVSYTFSYGTWFFAAGTFFSNTITNTVTLYVNGVSVGSGNPSTGTLATNNIFIGVDQNAGAVSLLSISNVQMYNTTLSQGEISNLYLEGIGGAPTKIQNLVGWWPLNGNTRDYSGYNNNGAITGNVVFNSTWSSAYTPP